MADYVDGIAMSLENIAKKVNEGKTNEIKPEDIAAIAKCGSGFSAASVTVPVRITGAESMTLIKNYMNHPNQMERANRIDEKTIKAA